MKLRLLIPLTYAVLAPCVSLLADTQIPDATLSGTNTVVRSATFTTNSGSTLTISGAIAGTPTDGTLDLGSVALKVKPPGSGATSRDVALQIKDIGVNAKTWGAVGDATTDDTSAIHAAVALGQTVIVPPSQYKLASTLTLDGADGQPINGSGVEQTMFIAAANTNALMLAGRYKTIADLTLAGTGNTGTGTANSGNGIQMGSSYSPGNFHPRHLLIRGFNVGINNNYGWDACSLNDLYITNCYTGFYTYGNQDCVTLNGVTITNGDESNPVPTGTVAFEVDGSGRGEWNGGVSGGNDVTAWVARSGTGGVLTIRNLHLEGTGGVYTKVGTAGELHLENSYFADGPDGGSFIHVQMATNSFAQIDNCEGYNGALIRVVGSGHLDVRSKDFCAEVYDGDFHRRAAPWHFYSSWETLPTASALSEPVFQVGMADGSGGVSELHTYFKTVSGGVFRNQQIDGTAAGLDVDTDGTLAANSDSKIATQKAVKTYVDGTTTDVARGGTNITSYTAGDILYATGSAALTKLPKGSDGQVLTIDPATHLPAWTATSSTRSVYGAKLSAQLNMYTGNNGAGYVDGSFHDNPDLQIASIPTGTYDVDLWFFMSMQSGDTGLKWKLSGSATYTGSTYFEAIEDSTTGTETTGFLNGASVAAAAFSDHLLHYHGQIFVTEPGSFKVQLGTPTAGESGQLRSDTHFELRKVN